MRPPSVDVLARSVAVDLPHPLRVEAARAAIDAGEPDLVDRHAEVLRRTLLQPVINATGVLLHTNLGRAPLEVHQPAGYRNVEIDLDTGERGDRSAHAGALLARLCGAERAIVVNNGAAAVLVAVAAVADGRPVLVSRGELVEIGGGFRIPDVVAQSGSRLVEVGTTNRTRLADHQRALARHPDAAAVLTVHRSNFTQDGFTESVPVGELSRLGPPVIADIGSGLVDADCPWLAGPPPPWLDGEPAARQTIESGAGLVTFSGDKLLGGPQAGVIAGAAELVARCAHHPLMRAVRPGALVLAALQNAALAYLGRDLDRLPFWAMATADPALLETRARAVAATVGGGWRAVPTTATVGGGAAPGSELASWGVARGGDHSGALRRREPPIVARVVDGSTVCDLRTVSPDDDHRLVEALGAVGG